MHVIGKYPVDVPQQLQGINIAIFFSLTHLLNYSIKVRRDSFMDKVLRHLCASYFGSISSLIVIEEFLNIFFNLLFSSDVTITSSHHIFYMCSAFCDRPNYDGYLLRVPFSR